MDINGKKLINNLTEDYCSFEVSKLLKEKGFKVEGKWYYRPHFKKKGKPFISWGVEYDSDCYVITDWNTNVPYPNKPEEVLCSAPTHAIAIKWIRENFGIYIETYMTRREKFSWLCNKHNSDIPVYSSPEEATEAALLYTLENLIK